MKSSKQHKLILAILLLAPVIVIGAVVKRKRSKQHSRPTGILRLAFRIPTYIYRFRMGWVFGHRVLMLTHTGRRTGQTHRTVLEVVRYDPATRTNVVVSGWGSRSDWYRNIKANPAREVESGIDRYVPDQRFLTPDEVYREIVDYKRRHPFLIRFLGRYLGFLPDDTDQSLRAFADSLRMVAFQPALGKYELTF